MTVIGAFGDIVFLSLLPTVPIVGWWGACSILDSTFPDIRMAKVLIRGATRGALNGDLPRSVEEARRTVLEVTEDTEKMKEVCARELRRRERRGERKVVAGAVLGVLSVIALFTPVKLCFLGLYPLSLSIVLLGGMQRWRASYLRKSAFDLWSEKWEWREVAKEARRRVAPSIERNAEGTEREGGAEGERI